MSMENDYFIPSYKLSMNDSETLLCFKSCLEDAIKNDHDIVYFYENNDIQHDQIFANIDLIEEQRIHLIADNAITSGPLIKVSDDISFTYRIDGLKSFYLTFPIFELILQSIESNGFNNIAELVTNNVLRKFVFGSTEAPLVEDEIVIVVPFRNCIDFIDACYESLSNQNYSNYRIVLIDDCSIDGTSLYIEKFQNERTTILRNQSQLYAVESLVSALTNLELQKNPIIIIVDGDDILLHNFVLQTVNWYYSFYRCKLTYGSFMTIFNGHLYTSSYAKEDFDDIRNANWHASHLKTFHYDLFAQLREAPNFENNFKDEDGHFLKAPYDMALMFPLLELAGYKYSKHIEYPLYGYRIHDNNDHVVIRNEQQEGERILREKKSYLTANQSESNINTNIPKIVHQIVGPNTTPIILNCLESWGQLLEYQFEVRIWNDTTLVEFISKEHPFALEAFVNARNHAEAADIARYLIIYTYGGYYVDWDIELLDIDDFFALSNIYKNGYMLIDPSNETLASEYFCSIPADKYLLKLTDDIVELYNNGLRESFHTPQYSGPYRMRDSLAKHKNTIMALVPVKEVFVYDYSEIRYSPQPKPRRPLIHYWVHSWL